MNLTLDNFEQVIESRILARGLNYFRDEKVIELEFHEDQAVWEAEVEGTETYEVRIERAVDGTLECICTCPYDKGEHCKHMAAVLYAIAGSRPVVAEKKTRGSTPQRKSPKARLARLLGDADHETLAAIILEIAQQDKALMNRIIVRLDAEHAQAEDYQQLVKDALKTGDWDHGFLDYQGSNRAASAVNRLIAQATKWIESGEVARAVSMCEAVIDEVTPIMGSADDSDGRLGGCVAKSVEHLDRCAELLSEVDQDALFAYCLDRACRSEFFIWDWGWELLESAEHMVTGPGRRELYTSALDRLERSTQTYKESAFSREFDRERIALRRLSLIERLDGDAAAEEFMRAHLNITGIRALFIERCFEEGRLDEADALIRDGIALSKKQRYPGLEYGFRKLQLRLRMLQGDTQAVVAMARELWQQRPDEEMYALLKQTVPAADWPAFVDRMIADVKRNSDIVAWVYAQEQRWGDLLHLVHSTFMSESIAEAYRAPLEKNFPQDMASIYGVYIQNTLEQHTGRNYYVRVAQYLRRMKKLIPPADVDALTAQLRSQYPTRRALLDELNRV